MIWIILGIIFTILTYLSLKGVTIIEYSLGEEVCRYHVRIWMIIAAFISYCIPYFNIGLFVFYHLWFINLASNKVNKDDYDCTVMILSKDNIMHVILGAVSHYLMKEI